MFRFLLFILITFFGLIPVAPAEVQANPSHAITISNEFAVPGALRQRVNFWRDIFTKYGKGHLVIHHRQFPQIVFLVLDLTRELQSYDPVSFSKFKSRVERENVERLRREFEVLAQGNQPRTAMQRLIAQKMSALGGGAEKYATVLREDLIRTQTGIREKYAEAVWRSGRYMKHIEKIFVEEYGLPVELTRLPFIESSFDYTAYSSVGAAGIWQFMPRTGKLYMTVNQTVDERRDPIASSRAAAKYLIEARRRLGNWPLALTSYNHGIAGVAGKVRKYGTSDISQLIENQREQAFGFASSNFYPEFLAAVEIYQNYRRYFPGLELRPLLRVREVRLAQATSVQHILRQTGLSLEALKECNYALSRHVWNGRYKIPAGYRLKIPEGGGIPDVRPPRLYQIEPIAPVSGPSISAPPTVPEVERRSTSAVYGGIIYTVRRGDTLLSIAKKFDTTVKELQRINKLKAPKVREGQLLTIKTAEGSDPGAADELAPLASNAQPLKGTIKKTAEKRSTAAKRASTKTEATPRTATTYTVRKGDTMWSISRKFAISVDELSRANTVAKRGLVAGQKLKIPAKAKR